MLYSVERYRRGLWIVVFRTRDLSTACMLRKMLQDRRPTAEYRISMHLKEAPVYST